jgi:cysteine desulfurase
MTQSSTPTRHYFDYAAATPIDKHVLTAMQPYFSNVFANPSAVYHSAQQAKQALDNARQLCAQTLGVQSSEIVFTAGGSEANNLAISGVILAQTQKASCAVSAIEHDSVLEPAQQFRTKQFKVMNDGRIDVTNALQDIDDTTALVSVMLVNNELGTIQPIRQLAQGVAQIRRDRIKRGVKLPLLLHTDACQAPNVVSVQPHRLGVDLMTLNSGKIYGPKQCGLLYVRRGVELQPIIFGGGQEFGLRSGSQNVAAIVGFSQALHGAVTMQKEEVARLNELKQRILFGLGQLSTEVQINGGVKYAAPNFINVCLRGFDAERLVFALDAAGIEVAVGSACSASSSEPSHVLRAIGLTDADAQSSLRITLGRGTNHKSIDALLSALRQLII